LAQILLPNVPNSTRGRKAEGPDPQSVVTAYSHDPFCIHFPTVGSTENEVDFSWEDEEEEPSPSTDSAAQATANTSTSSVRATIPFFIQTPLIFLPAGRQDRERISRAALYGAEYEWYNKSSRK
jgi:hypothetical protein